MATNTSSRLCSEVARLNGEIDRLHQYSQRNCLVVSGIPVRKNETTEDLRKEFEKKVIQDLDITSEEYDFEYDKIHRVGKIDGNEQNVIVRFRSHQFPAELYYNRKRIKNKRIKLKPSLTETRTELLRTLIDKTTDNKKVTFCYADFNGNIKIRLKEKHKEKSVYQIENMDKFTELMNDMTSSNEQ